LGNSITTVQFSTDRHKMNRPKNKKYNFTDTYTTLKKAVNIFLLAFYFFGTFCLPFGDFSMLQDIPEMYRHCKASEDKDMTAFDFVTDHLLNIDIIFDKHENGDEQKPHEPKQTEHQGQPTVFFFTHFSFSLEQFEPVENKPSISSVNFLSSGYISKFFRPPIV